MTSQSLKEREGRPTSFRTNISQRKKEKEKEGDKQRCGGRELEKHWAQRHVSKQVYSDQ